MVCGRTGPEINIYHPLVWLWGYFRLRSTRPCSSLNRATGGFSRA